MVAPCCVHNLESLLLDSLNSRHEIRVAGDEYCDLKRTFPCQREKIRSDRGVDSLLWSSLERSTALRTLTGLSLARIAPDTACSDPTLTHLYPEARLAIKEVREPLAESSVALARLNACVHKGLVEREGIGTTSSFEAPSGLFHQDAWQRRPIALRPVRAFVPIELKVSVVDEETSSESHRGSQDLMTGHQENRHCERQCAQCLTVKRNTGSGNCRPPGVSYRQLSDS